jgi:hypothetical protein
MTARAQQAPLRPAATAPPSWDRTDQRIATTFLVLLVLTQRFGIPVGDTSIAVAIPLTYVFAGVLLARRSLTVGRLRAELFLLALAGCLAVTAVVSMLGGTMYMTSLYLMIVIYLPWLLRIPGWNGKDAVQRLGRTFVRLMLILAAMGIAQFGSQLAGIWTYEDYIGELVPPDFLVPFFNTTIPLVYGSDTFKSQAFILLEPSTLSQFCALAVIIGLMLRVPAWQVLVLVAGLASAVSGTGIILLIFGAALLLLRAPRRLRTPYLVASAMALVLVLLSPVAAILLDRTSEVSQPRSSGYARFVAPYQEVQRGLNDEPLRYLVGEGPGSVDRVLASRRDGIGADVLYSLPPKVLFEYGLLAGGLFILFLLLTTLDRAPWRVVPGAVVLMMFFLSGGLLHPQTTTLAWLFTGLGATEESPPSGPPPPPVLAEAQSS